MKNLLYVTDKNGCIRKELSLYGIPEVVVLPNEQTDLESSVGGKLGKFTFFRASDFWIVRWHLPLVIAQELYRNPVGHKDILARGDSDRPAPETVASWFTAEGKSLFTLEVKIPVQRLIDKGVFTQEESDRVFLFADEKDFSKLGELCIPGFHIMSDAGMNLFLETIRKHKLV